MPTSERADVPGVTIEEQAARRGQVPGRRSPPGGRYGETARERDGKPAPLHDPGADRVVAAGQDHQARPGEGPSQSFGPGIHPSAARPLPRPLARTRLAYGSPGVRAAGGPDSPPPARGWPMVKSFRPETSRPRTWMSGRVWWAESRLSGIGRSWWS